MTNTLQTIIDGPGDYRTRDGRRVTIHGVDGKGSASASGAIWKEFRGKLRPRGYHIWQPNGLSKFIGTSNRDIVARWV